MASVLTPVEEQKAVDYYNIAKKDELITHMKNEGFNETATVAVDNALLEILQQGEVTPRALRRK